MSRFLSFFRFALRPRRASAQAFHPRVRAAVLLLVATGVLAACTPTYDWRTVMNNDNGYTVDLPAKPSADERQVEIGGVSMKMLMQTAEAADAVFVVGTVVLPDDQVQTQRAALEFLRTGLARNLGVAPDSTRPRSRLLQVGRYWALK